MPLYRRILTSDTDFSAGHLHMLIIADFQTKGDVYSPFRASLPSGRSPRKLTVPEVLPPQLRSGAGYAEEGAGWPEPQPFEFCKDVVFAPSTPSQRTPGRYATPTYRPGRYLKSDAMASAVNRNQPVARNLDSLFEAHGNEPHVASHVDDNVQPTSVATPGRMGQRYPSSPFGISGSVLANASVTEPTTTALRDYDARPNRLLASDMVERMEALREQLMRVSSTLSGVQERAASLTAALERSRKSLAQEADSAPRSHMPAAAMPTPSTQPRGAVRASPCGNVGMPPAAASPLPVAAARADAGVEPKAHVFTVTVTTATSPDVSRLPVASSSSRDAGWEEGERFGVAAWR